MTTSSAVRLTPVDAGYKPRARSVYVVVTRCVLLATTVGFLAGASSTDSPYRRAWAGGIALGSLSLALALSLPRDKRPRRSHLRLMPVILAWWSVAFGFASTAWGSQQVTAQVLVLPSSVVHAEWVTGLAIICMWLGYVITNPKSDGSSGFLALRSAVGRWNRLPIAVPGIVGVYSLCLTGRIGEVVTTGGFGYLGSTGQVNVTALSSAFDVLNQLGPLALFVACVAFGRRRTLGRFALALGIAVGEVGTDFMTGNKESFVLTGIALLVAWVSLSGRVPILVIVGGLLAYVYVLTPFNAAFRESVRSGSETAGPLAAASAVPQVAQQALSGANRTTSFEAATSRWREIDNVAVIVQRTPQDIGYRSVGELVAAPLVSIVPRAVWPGKPVYDTGLEFTQQYYGSSLFTASAITFIGDLYRHGGLLVVTSGMFLLGSFLVRLDRIIDSDGVATGMIFIVFLPSLMKGETDVAGWLRGLPIDLLVLFIAIRLMNRHGRGARA